jgi:type III secretion system FlhB-like substrate exporter
LIAEKRVIIIAYDDTQDSAKEIRLLSTVWLTKAFIDTAKLRFVNLSESADFVKSIGME